MTIDVPAEWGPISCPSILHGFGLTPVRWFFRESDETKPDTFVVEILIAQLALHEGVPAPLRLGVELLAVVDLIHSTHVEISVLLPAGSPAAGSVLLRPF